MASGQLSTIILDPDGTQSRFSAIGFGYAMNNIAPASDTIDISGLSDSVSFTVPRNGLITAIGATFSNNLPVLVPDAGIALEAILYAAPANSNLFTQLENTLTELASWMEGMVPAGQVFTQLNDTLSVPVTAGTRLMLVLRLVPVAGSLTTVIQISGTAGAGIEIT